MQFNFISVFFKKRKPLLSGSRAYIQNPKLATLLLCLIDFFMQIFLEIQGKRRSVILQAGVNYLPAMVGFFEFLSAFLNDRKSDATSLRFLENGLSGSKRVCPNM